MSGKLTAAAQWFVCCFSRTDKDLGQWRAYGDDGKGYAIGFDAKVLENAFITARAEDANHSTFPVKYDDKKICELLENLTKETISFIETPRGKDLPPQEIANFLAALSDRLAASCILLSLCFKHEAYVNEQEYRFLQSYPITAQLPELLFRTRPYALVRDQEFNWKKVAASSIKEIVCGPANDPKIAEKFAADCRRAYLQNEVIAIRTSSIPYRSVRN